MRSKSRLHELAESATGIPVLSIDGTPYYNLSEIPRLPPPARLIVRVDDHTLTLQIDKLTVKIDSITEPFLEWLTRQASLWAAVEPTTEGRRQIVGVIEAIEHAYLRQTRNA
jgi:hypothetical protein